MKELTRWNSMTRRAKDSVIALVLALLTTLGLFGSGGVTANAGVQNYKLNVSMELGGTVYEGIMHAAVNGDGEYFPGAADMELTSESGRELRAHIVSLAKEAEDGRYNLSYSASVLGDGETEPTSFEGEAIVFPADDGYRIAQVIRSGESTSSGTNAAIHDVGLGSGIGHSASSSKGTLTLRFSNVNVLFGRHGIMKGREIVLPNIPVPERE